MRRLTAAGKGKHTRLPWVALLALAILLAIVAIIVFLPPVVPFSGGGAA
jgi:hypothetical protein